MKIPFLGIDVTKGNSRITTLEKEVTKLKDDALARPMDTFMQMIQTGGIRIPYNTPVSKQQMFEMADYSDIHSNIRMALKTEVFRNGFEIKENFVCKCLQCGKEFDYDVSEKCDECGAGKDKIVHPDVMQKQRLEQRTKNMNFNKQNLTDVLMCLEDDVNVIDDMYMLILKDYYYNDVGEIIGGEVTDITRAHPVFMYIIADKKGRPGRNEEGKKVFTCPVHRQHLYTGETQKTCPQCGKKLYRAYYKAMNIGAGEDIHYINGEVIHASKFQPSLTYGFPPIMKVWVKVVTLMLQDDYIREYFGNKRPPKGILAIKTKAIESLQKAMDWVLQKAKQNPHVPIPLAVQNESGGQFIQFIDFMKSLNEMQYTEVRNEYRRQIGAVYGVMPLFTADTSMGAGLNNEGLQVTVTNRAVAMSQYVYNEKVLPELVKQLGITDYHIELSPSEERDEMAELQREQQKIANAQMMKNLGFNVKLKEQSKPDEIDFEYESNEGEEMFGEQPIPELPIASPTPGLPRPKPPQQQGGQPTSLRPGETQRFESEPTNVRRSLEINKNLKKRQIWVKDPRVEGGGYYRNILDKPQDGKPSKPTGTPSSESSVNQITEKIPKQFSSYLSGKIQRVDKPIVAQIDTTTGDLFIGNKWDDISDTDRRDVIYHEIGHRIIRTQFENNEQVMEENLKDYEEGFRKEPKFDDDPLEDLSDTLTAYMIPEYRQEMEAKMPKKFATAKRILSMINQGKSLTKDSITSTTTGVHNPRYDKIRKIFLNEQERIEKEIGTNVDISIRKDYMDDLIKFLEASLFGKTFENIGKRTSDKMKHMILDGMVDKMSADQIMRRVKREVPKYITDGEIERIVNTEVQNLQNKAREFNYEVADPENKFRYKWINPLDNRTTSVCRKIVDRTRDGVTMKRLKQIIDEEGKKGGFTPRDYTPHINCRSSFVRVFH